MIDNNYIVVGAFQHKGTSINQSTGAAFIFRNDTFNRTSFYNLEASIDDYRIFNKRLTNAEISDSGGNAAIGGNANFYWVMQLWIQWIE